MKKSLKILLKLLVACAILALVLHKAEGEEVWNHLKAFHAGVMVPAVALAIVGHILASERMRFFLGIIAIPMEHGRALRLYFVGALFNLVLPAGVGGDAVKAWALNRQHDAVPLRRIIKALILDRASGLFVLCLIALGGFVLLPDMGIFTILAWVGFPVVTAAYFFLAWRLFGQKMADGMKALVYSFVSQGLWCAIIWVLYKATGNGDSAIAYIMLYAAASIVSLVPVTVGGLGLREMTFYYGALWLQHHANILVDAERGIALSLALFAVYLLSSLPGLFCLSAVGRGNPIKNESVASVMNSSSAE